MISVVIPAFREAQRIGGTLAGVRCGAQMLSEPLEVIVVDDGSDDGTADQALRAFRRWGDQKEHASEPERPNARTPEDPSLRLVRLEYNQGKGAALSRGLREACGEWIVMLDADLDETASQFPRLLAPVQMGDADMTMAVFPDLHRTANCPLPTAHSKGGLGLALRTARWGVTRLTGRVLKAPLSGQRAFAAANLPLLLPLEPGFGLEVGLDIDALRAGLRVLEVPTTMAHAATGRDWTGFRHRGRQMAHILRALARRGFP